MHIYVRSTPSLSFVARRLRMASFLNSLAHSLKKCFSYWQKVKLPHFYFWFYFSLISTYHQTTHTHTDRQKPRKSNSTLQKKKVFVFYQPNIQEESLYNVQKSMMESSVTFCCSLPFHFFLSRCLFPSGSNEHENENDEARTSSCFCYECSKWKGLILVCSEHLLPHMFMVLGILKIMGSSLSPHTHTQTCMFR